VLPAALRTAVSAAAELGIRVQMIRRPGRRGPAAFSVFAGWTAGRSPWLEHRELTQPSQLADLDLTRLTRLSRGCAPGFGTPVTGPLILVCTHGRRNACCARLGGPLARALAARHAGQVWETTHVGGDLHAANMVILPHGLYYGPADQGLAEAASEAYQRGEVILDRYRGRAGTPVSAQAAEHLIRKVTGLCGIGDLGPPGPTPAGSARAPGPGGRVARAGRAVRTGRMSAQYRESASGDRPVNNGK
jgi:hypothetical protein